MNENDDSKFDTELKALTARLPTAVSPSRDLWGGIEQAICTPARRERTVWNSMWAQAAAVVLLVGASSALTYTLVKEEGNGVTPIDINQPQRIFQTVSGGYGIQYTLGPEYQDARMDLEAKLENELERMDPETRAAVMANIEAIRQAISQINAALAAEPDNALLQELLLSTYRDELSLMRKVEGISSAAMRRDDI